MEKDSVGCSTPGHEDKPQHGRSGLCQACYRRKRRRELDPSIGTRKPGPAPDPAAPRSRHRETAARPAGQRDARQRLTDEEKAERLAARRASKTICVNNHALTPENSYVTAKGQKVCRICTRNAQQRFHGRPETGDTPVGPRNAEKTHCVWGHEYTPENTYLKPDRNGTTSRACKKCHREHRLMRTYGLARGQYDAMYEEQSGHCAGCETELEEGRNLHVDHDHDTGAVRGLLCSDCNLGLGKLKDSPEVLRRLAEYVERGRL